jgi:hypothetical protein
MGSVKIALDFQSSVDTWCRAAIVIVAAAMCQLTRLVERRRDLSAARRRLAQLVSHVGPMSGC